MQTKLKAMSHVFYSLRINQSMLLLKKKKKRSSVVQWQQLRKRMSVMSSRVEEVSVEIYTGTGHCILSWLATRTITNTVLPH